VAVIVRLIVGMVVIMVMMMIVDMISRLIPDQDIELRGSDAIADRFGGFVCCTKPQVFETVDECLRVGAGVDQGTDGHISAYTGECVKVGNSHELRSLLLLNQFWKDLTAWA
jgi:hypothetical protein